MNDRQWFWPQSYNSGSVSWFNIIRRLLFWPLLVLGRCICFVAVVGGHGLIEAKKEFWK